MKVLVSGGCGFIGSHLVDELISIGIDVVVIDIKAKPLMVPRNPKAQYAQEDIRKIARIESYFKDVNCVFHLAAESRIQASIDNPIYAAEVNIMGTINMIECCSHHKVPRFINSSTSSVYGLTDRFPTAETTPTDCLNPYASTKLAAEEMIKCYVKLGKIERACSLRYFNVFGEYSPVTGPYSLVIGIFLQQLAAERSLTVVGDGSAERDFVYVKDVVNANILAMRNDQHINGESYNIGSGRNISVLNIAKLLSDKIEFIPPRQGEAKTTLADYSLANNNLGWSPRVFLEDWLVELTKYTGSYNGDCNNPTPNRV